MFDNQQVVRIIAAIVLPSSCNFLYNSIASFVDNISSYIPFSFVIFYNYSSSSIHKIPSLPFVNIKTSI